MDEKDFELLRLLDETRNMTRAAERLFITQSALSKRVKLLEQDLGVELILRSRTGVRFTPAGEAVLAHSAAAARHLEQMRRDLDSMQDEVCGTLNAGVSINYALYRLPDVLAGYHKRYPKVRLCITTGQSRHLYRQMLDGSLDAAILRGEYPWDGMKFLLSQESICLVCSQANRDRPLTDYPYISHQTDAEQAAMIARWMHDNGLSAQAAGFCVDSVTTCLEMVKRGLGWALLPEIALDRFDGVILPCTFEDGEPMMRRMHIFYQRNAMDLPQIRAFIETVKRGQALFDRKGARK